VEQGFVQGEIEASAFAWQQQVESAERVIVGVNKYAVESEQPIELQTIDPAAERRQLERTAKLRAERSADEAAAALARVREAGPHDVTWAHFLFPAGFIAAGAGGPLVVTAHGRDVRNIGGIPGVARATARVVERASTVIAVSHYLRRELEERLPAARGKT